MVNGREVGSSTIPSGTRVIVLQEANAQLRIKSSMGESWVATGSVERAPQPTVPDSSPGTPEPIPSPVPPAQADAILLTNTGTSSSVSQQILFIRALDSDIQVERFGTGSRGLIFFSHTGNLAEDIRKNIESYGPLLRDKWSIFLFKYPERIFRKISESPDYRPDYSGFASTLIAELRKTTRMREFCLVGNSMGGGVILWDIDALSKDQDLSFILISPTPQFCPQTLDKKKKYPRTSLFAVEQDPFIGPLPPLFQKNMSSESKQFAGRGHLIVGDNLSHSETVLLIQNATRVR